MPPPFDGKNFTAIAQQVSSRSAVNPTLWACFVISLPLFLLARNSDGLFAILYFIIACLPVIAFLGSYFLFVFTNPKYLRSEEYQLRAEAMTLIGDRDNPFHGEAKDIIAVISNPELAPPTAALPSPKDHD
ncbi:MAG: hypothetical protein Q7R79_00410 [bacterium]|nr:hypothetical protein [bacterium]